jgi:hypothetical protein
MYNEYRIRRALGITFILPIIPAKLLPELKAWHKICLWPGGVRGVILSDLEIYFRWGKEIQLGSPARWQEE